MKKHFGKLNIQKQKANEPFKFYENEGETDSNSEDDDTPPPNFVHSGWGENAPEEPTGINFKAEKNLACSDKLKTLLKKGSKRYRYNNKTHVCTLQVDKVKSQDTMFEILLAETLVRYALEEAMKENNIKNILKD